MSHLFESFEFLDRGWDVRVLENVSLRSMFLWLLLMLFAFGMGAGIELYALIHHLHHLSLSTIVIFAIYAVFAFRYARVIYRRLGR